MPPLPWSVSDKAVPTAPVKLVLVVVTAGAAAMVIVAVPDFDVLATDVAVIVTDCDEPVAAGAVYVAELVVALDSVPGPLIVQVTPLEPWSLVTVAVSVVVSLPSTELAATVTLTLIGLELPPHPVRVTKRVNKHKAGIRNSRETLRSNISTSSAFMAPGLY